MGLLVSSDHAQGTGQGLQQHKPVEPEEHGQVRTDITIVLVPENTVFSVIHLILLIYCIFYMIPFA